MKKITRKYTDEQEEKGRRKLRDYDRFKEENQGRGGAWEYVERRAREMYEDGVRISGRALLEDVRRRDLADRDGRPVRANNNFAAILARDLIRLHPEYRPRVELRPCVFDVLM